MNYTRVRMQAQLQSKIKEALNEKRDILRNMPGSERHKTEQLIIKKVKEEFQMGYKNSKNKGAENESSKKSGSKDGSDESGQKPKHSEEGPKQAPSNEEGSSEDKPESGSDESGSENSGDSKEVSNGSNNKSGSKRKKRS